MRFQLPVAAAAALVSLLAGCATSGLQSAAKLGESGGKLMAQASAPYSRSAELLRKNATMHCASASLLKVDTGECNSELSKTVDDLAEILVARSAFYDSLGAYYASFADTAKLPPISLTEATNASVGLAQSLAVLMHAKFGDETKAAFKAHGARLEALVQMAEESQRLKRLRSSSGHIRAALAVAAASYDVERRVTESIARLSAAQRSNLITALSANNLLDVAAVAGRASDVVGVPVLAYGKDSQAAWRSPEGRKFMLYVAEEEQRAVLRQQEEANRVILSGIKSLVTAHAKFETERSITPEDVDVFSKRLAVLLAQPT
jgi:hypothetical protein